MKYKFVASDMDGTLLNGNHAVSKRNVEAINRYISAGGIFTVATGRCFRSAVMCLDGLNITAPAICFHGGLVADVKTGAALYEKPIPTAVSIEVLKWLEKRGNFYTQVYTGDSMTVEKWTQITQWYADVCGVKADVAGIQLSGAVEEGKKALHKILAIVPPETASRLVKEINEEFVSVSAALSRPDFVEIFSRETDKGLAADYVLKMYGLTRGDMLAVGDGMNDLPLLKAAGFAAAVGNAAPEVKAVADFVGDTNDKDGVAKIIEKFCL